ncbi:glycosyltransferase family 39 protein [Actinocatenispora thailandica]|nr:glycosyltransferase family 39 protein [Actinocatenispora thailandica]
MVATLSGGDAGASTLRRERLGTARAVSLAVLVASVVAGAGLGRKPLSWDEAVSLSAAQHRLSGLAALLAHTDAPLGAYYLLLHGWLALGRLLGQPPVESWVRLPSLVGAVVAVGCIVALAARYVGPPAAAVAGVLLAVHPTFVFYAQDARPYGLATAAIAAATVLFVRALDRPSPGRLASYAGVAVLAVALHLFAALALLAHAVVAVRRGRPAGRWVLTAMAVAIAVTPLVLVSARQTAEVSWIPPASPRAVASVLTHLYGGPLVLAALLAVVVAVLATRYGPHRAAVPVGDPPTGRWTGLRSMLPTLRASPVAGVPRLPRTGPARPPVAPWSVPIVVALLPPVLLVAADLLRPVLVARYALVALPATVLAVTGAAVRGGRVARAMLAVALVAAVGTTAVQQLRPYKYENFRAATDAVTDTARPGDGMLFLPLSSRVGYLAYAGRDRDGHLPADPLLRRAPRLADRIGGREVAARLVPARVHAARRIFLYGTDLAALSARPGPSSAPKVRAVAGWRVRWIRHFGAVSVALLTPPRPATPPATSAPVSQPDPPADR